MKAATLILNQYNELMTAADGSFGKVKKHGPYFTLTVQGKFRKPTKQHWKYEEPKEGKPEPKIQKPRRFYTLESCIEYAQGLFQIYVEKTLYRLVTAKQNE